MNSNAFKELSEIDLNIKTFKQDQKLRLRYFQFN